MAIWHRAPRTILQLLLSSTAHKFYFTEIQNETNLSSRTVTVVLDRLLDAKVVIREQERPNFDSANRAPRVYYSIAPSAVAVLRLP